MNDFQNYLADEFAEDYSEGRLTRREALKLIDSVTGGQKPAGRGPAASNRQRSRRSVTGGQKPAGRGPAASGSVCDPLPADYCLRKGD